MIAHKCRSDTMSGATGNFKNYEDRIIRD